MINNPSGADWLSVIVLAWILLSAVAMTVQATWRAAGRRHAEADWERRHVLGERPAPLDLCCMLARHSDGAAHDRRKCTDEFHRITADLA
ncbi:hypothetical protein AB0I98_16915 [Streptomyces sp. NPDC050211]|uniref:hypothetical protein n=1 Tax=Streptomyces sp. NPDC050211 TaxID=3154932 RepID=UPI0034147320